MPTVGVYSAAPYGPHPSDARSPGGGVAGCVAKVGVTGSNPVVRSPTTPKKVTFPERQGANDYVEPDLTARSIPTPF